MVLSSIIAAERGYIDDVIMPHATRNVLQRVIRQGRVHLSMMLLSILRNWEAPLFAPSPDLRRMTARLPKG